jgi:hypothetical protein
MPTRTRSAGLTTGSKGEFDPRMRPSSASPNPSACLPDLVLVPDRDHTDYQRLHLMPGLAKRRLTVPERAAIRDHEATVFTPDGGLRPGAMPPYIPGPASGYVGQVSAAPRPPRGSA